MFKKYLVGGAIRDNFLGKKSNDIDYAVEAESFKSMKEILLQKKFIIFQEKKEFLSIRAKDITTNIIYDFTMCRLESGYSDHRHPDNVSPGTILDDLLRRDFTMNAIAKR